MPTGYGQPAKRIFGVAIHCWREAGVNHETDDCIDGRLSIPHLLCAWSPSVVKWSSSAKNRHLHFPFPHFAVP